MSRTPSVSRPAAVAALCAATLALTGLTAAAPSAVRVTAHPYEDVPLPVTGRVAVPLTSFDGAPAPGCTGT